MATSAQLRAALTTPPTKVGDGQCVPYVRETLPFDNVPVGAYGNAVDWWDKTPQILLDHYDKIATTNFITGDILIWGDDEGTFTGKFGHIARWLDGKIINQNNGGRQYVTLDNFFSGGFRGVLRLKGGDMPYTTEQYLVAADAVGTTLGNDFNYPADWTNDQFVQFMDGQATPISPEMEKKVAETLTGVKGIIGKDYNSPYVGKKGANNFYAMFLFWLDYANDMPKPPTGEYTVVAEVDGKPTLYTKDA